MSHPAGLTRDAVEALWDKGRIRCERLDFDHNSLEGLAKYIVKNKRCKRHWRQSRGLAMPKRPQPNDSKWSRKKLRNAFENCLEDGAFWEKQYPGYRLHRCEPQITGNGTMHLVVKMYRKDGRNQP